MIDFSDQLSQIIGIGH